MLKYLIVEGLGVSKVPERKLPFFFRSWYRFYTVKLRENVPFLVCYRWCRKWKWIELQSWNLRSCIDESAAPDFPRSISIEVPTIGDFPEDSTTGFQKIVIRPAWWAFFTVVIGDPRAHERYIRPIEILGSGDSWSVL